MIDRRSVQTGVVESDNYGPTIEMYSMVWYGILYLNQGNTLAPTILSWFPC